MILCEIFAGKCPSCGSTCPMDEPLCEVCNENLTKFDNFCKKCGYPISDISACCRRCENGSAKHADKVYIYYKYNGAMRDVLLDIKFKYNIRSALTLKKMIVIPEFDKVYDAVIAVPSHFLRRFRRFFHPAEIVAFYLSKSLGLPMSKDLKRSRYTGFQFKRGSKDRKKNVKDAFVFDNVNKYKNILLIDDIFTTGATIDECARILKRGGVKRVDCLCIAKD